MVLLKRQAARLGMTRLGQEQQQKATVSPSQKQEYPRDVNSLEALDRTTQARGSPTSKIPREGTLQDNTESRLHSSFLIAALQMLPLPKFEPGSDLFAARVAFQLRLRDCLARERHTPPRGVFYFSGPVGLQGPKGFCRVEVKGEYNPASASWSRVTVQLKDLNLFNQKALGGS